MKENGGEANKASTKAPILYPLYFKNLKQNIYHARRFNIIQRLLLTYYSCYCCWCSIRGWYGCVISLLIN